MIQLSNHSLAVTIKSQGAELTRIKSLEHEIDYLWDGDPEYWGKHAPVLFPIVGTLRDNSYLFAGQSYGMLRHGFARDRVFSALHQTDTSATLELQSDEDSLKVYPFPFRLRIHYSLEGNKLSNRYEVINTGNGPMYFSVGGHPAFHVPLQEGLAYTDYYLEFDQPETAPRWTLLDNLIHTHPQPFLENESIIPLSHELFASDAIVLKHLKSKTVSLKSKASPHGLTMRIDEFPYLGIWAAPEAPFVCLEPWQGIADSVYHNQQLETKEGIVALEPGASWSKAWDVVFW
jgi:galactose mutarotase-like enzyme